MIKEEVYFMKRKVRRGVFETNSSSVHSLTMCSGEEYKKWENGEVLYWEDKNKFGTREEIIEEMKNMKWYDGTPRYEEVDWENEDVVDEIFSDERIKTCEKYFENDWYETYEEVYTTQNGEEVVAFGYYRHD